ncbi:polysaccharide deacetylase family protein [Novosphingobium album (ex Hu et al. 2023)]|uniref:Chitooligosaccharide deacetylase n=1 Tax=Novosphingobium album (ex Hu et al. 2023) TaxID=2930093 RepID=A0ABT0B4I9_9SPHN|nr:polysaccharide deacetylase family protein [Novosphingobium album (ex Hu et al. 2023)]MCJ2179799.1 polysaccharide deacetylase family protein [Novosphingobium album (ex Hu et al. 2023)]
MIIERESMSVLGRRVRRSGGRILAYHSVGQPMMDHNDVPPKLFRRQLEWAVAHGYRFVPASEIARTGGGPMDLAITFDDGLRSVMTEAAPILKEFGAPWSLFVVTGWSEGASPWATGEVLGWRELERLAADGAEIGSHSVTHPDFGQLDGPAARDELERSRDMIKARLGFAPASFAIPLGQSANWTPVAMREAKAAGYDLIYAQAEETRSAGTIARTFITGFDNMRVFSAALSGVFDRWEEWG